MSDPQVEFEDTGDRLALIADVENALRRAMRVQIIANHRRLYGELVLEDSAVAIILDQLDPQRAGPGRGQPGVHDAAQRHDGGQSRGAQRVHHDARRPG